MKINFNKDYYSTLGVTPQNSIEEIRNAYRKLAIKTHPDRNPGNAKAEDQFKQIAEAYEILGNQNRKNQYDSYYRGTRGLEQDLEDFFRQSQTQNTTRQRYNPHFSYKDFEPPSAKRERRSGRRATGMMTSIIGMWAVQSIASHYGLLEPLMELDISMDKSIFQSTEDSWYLSTVMGGMMTVLTGPVAGFGYLAADKIASTYNDIKNATRTKDLF
jgi:curved DNA-binding protein CbpA